MCIYSAVGPAFAPVIPAPAPPDQLRSPWPWGPVPGTGLPISPENLKTVLDAFHKAVEAAKAADRAAGQADCTDPEKVKLEERVAELERRIASLEKWRAAP